MVGWLGSGGWRLEAGGLGLGVAGWLIGLVGCAGWPSRWLDSWLAGMAHGFFDSAWTHGRFSVIRDGCLLGVIDCLVA